MKSILLAALTGGIAAPLSCQIGLADQGEFSSSIASFLEVSGRTQQFYSPQALGVPRGGTVRMDGIWLRYDGPSQTTVGAPHALNSLVIRVGATERAIGEVGAVFDDNLDKSLVAVFSATNYVIPIDLIDNESAEEWGGRGGELHFPFAAPIDVQVSATGSLVLEFEVQVGAAHPAGDTQLDFAGLSSAGHVGTAISEGLSCGYPSANPQVLTDGDYDIGTSFKISGAGFPPAVPVFTWVTELLTVPTLLPGSLCWSYLDLQTGYLVQTDVTDSTGSFGGDPPFPIPPAPPLSGKLLYLQSAALTPPSAVNPLGIETSDYRTIRIGSRPSGPLPGWYVTRPGSTTEPVASVSLGGTLAVRLR